MFRCGRCTCYGSNGNNKSLYLLICGTASQMESLLPLEGIPGGNMISSLSLFQPALGHHKL